MPSLIAKLKYAVRFAADRMVRARLRAHARPWPVRPTPHSTLIIAPHPDDETLGCGGLIATRCAAGESVHILVLTDGAASHPGHPVLRPEALSLERKKETLAAAGILGVPPNRVYFLGLPDGQLPFLGEDALQMAKSRLAGLLKSESFDQVFVTWRHDASSEHQAAFQLVCGAISGKMRLMEYPIWSSWSPWKLLKILPSETQIYRMRFSASAALKHQAIQAYASQLHPIPPCREPALPPGFARLCQGSEEFFFESSL